MILHDIRYDNIHISYTFYVYVYIYTNLGGFFLETIFLSRHVKKNWVAWCIVYVYMICI